MPKRSVYVVDHDLYTKHNPGWMHPESPQRLQAIRRYVDRLQDLPLKKLAPRKAEENEILAVHTKEHLDSILSVKGQTTYLDPDTGVSEDSVDAAFYAAGGGIEAVKKVCESDTLDNAFALLRPPGHHAERDQAMGFCLFNNIAVAARAVIDNGWAKKVAIMDWDVHHGNGTQHAFERDAQIMYVSTHRYPFYPGTGHQAEIGYDEGEGTIVNVPLEIEANDGDYGVAFHEVVIPAIQKFEPDLLLVSAGFDAHRRDPLGGMRVSTDAFAAMCSLLQDLANELTNRGLALFLEGGYDLDALGSSVSACMKVLSGASASELPVDARASTSAVVNMVKEAHQKRW